MGQGAAQCPLRAVTQLPSVGVSACHTPVSPVRGNSYSSACPNDPKFTKNLVPTQFHPWLWAENPPSTGCVPPSLPQRAAQDPQGQVPSSLQGFALSHINRT